jgi:hypothetical protein
MRNQKKTYCFIFDDDNKYYRANQQLNGDYTITKDSQPYPILYDPTNLGNAKVEFGTNVFYNSLNRSVIEPLEFIKDGAAILRSFYHLGKRTQQNAYLTIVDWDGSQTPGRYTLTYTGKFDFPEKNEDPKAGKFTIALIDNSAWGILSRNEDVTYAIECNERNPKAIRVLFDGATLISRFTYQTVKGVIGYDVVANHYRFTIPFIKINQDGDSVGVISKNQDQIHFEYPWLNPIVDPLTPGWFFSTAYGLTEVNFSGTLEFDVTVYLGSSNVSNLFTAYFRSNLGQRYMVTPFVFPSRGITIIAGTKYRFAYDFTWDLEPGETVFFIVDYAINNGPAISPIITNSTISIKSTPQPAIVWGLRPLDLLQQIVAKATNSRFSINSLFFVDNNKDICIGGDSLRGIPNAKIYTSFKDFFATFDAIYWMALKTVLGQLWMEKNVEVYKGGTNLIDLGEVNDIQIAPAKEILINEIQIGSPNVDLRHPSGRLEFNSVNTFSLNMPSTKKKLDVITKYHLGCYEELFLMLDYRGESTEDNQSDTNVFVARISDDLGTATEDVETFENVSVNSAPLEPIIKSPLNNEIINFNMPVVRGIAPAGSNVNIYVDGILDGNTTAGHDDKWSYNIINPLDEFIDGIQTGEHLIEATYTDLFAPKTSINIIIFIDTVVNPQITYPTIDENLYNNKPLVKGIAQNGTNIDLSLDGVVIASVVADASCKWEFKIVDVFTNARHILSINAGADAVSFTVDTRIPYPLITYIASELDGFPIIDNLPLIEGIAMPNTPVDLWLNYIQEVKLGSTTSDANGNWSFQVTPVSYPDPITGTPIDVAPIQNGLNIISTSLVNHVVPIVVSGYMLSRPAYSSITGVVDNTIWNTELSPKRMLMNRYPLLAAIEDGQGDDIIKFQKPSKNGNLRTVLNGVVVDEDADVSTLDLGAPYALLENATIQVNTKKSFSAILENFNQGGYVRFSSRGTELFCLPIGTMKMSSLHSDVQEWKLLMAPTNTYRSLLNLYKNGTTINLMKNTIFHSDYNSIHMVTYNYQRPAKYNQTELYDDWFSKRNNQWILNPFYRQKFQTTDVVKDQVITNGISNLILNVYRCSDAKLIDAIPYVAVNPAPINPPEVVLEATISFSNYPDQSIFFVISVGGLTVAISERYEIRDNHIGTILIEASNSTNLVGAFFSTGLKTVLRVEGHIKKLQPEVDVILTKDRNGNTTLLYSNISKTRMIRYGTAYGLPDYLALKVASAITLDTLGIEGVAYTIKDGETIEPADEFSGHPLFYYNVRMNLVSNPQGATFAGAADSDRTGVILVVDALAVGLPTQSLINIELNND